MTKLPSYEDFVRELLEGISGDELNRALDIHTRDVLEAAAQAVEGRIEAYIDAVPNAMKKTIDLRNAVLSDAAAEIRKLKEGD